MPALEREHTVPAEEPGITVLRWVERPGGRMVQVELPLTPERFLNPQVGDQMTQGRRHGETAADLAALLRDHFRLAPDVLVLFDVKHRFGPALPEPGPDVSVIRGIRDKEADRESFDARKEGVLPSLIIEVVSPRDTRIRRADVEDKVEIYERARIQEYVIVDSTRRDRRYRLLGYRLGQAGRYLPLEQDADGRILSTTTDLWFQVAPGGKRVLVFEYPGGRQLLNLHETGEKARREAKAREEADERATREAKAREEADERARHAEERAKREAEARLQAEAEIVRLQAELERLRRNP